MGVESNRSNPPSVVLAAESTVAEAIGRSEEYGSWFGGFNSWKSEFSNPLNFQSTKIPNVNSK